MRLKPEIKAFIKETAAKLFPDTDIFLFGSRLNDLEKGGDIDLLILSDNKIKKKTLRQFRLSFYKKFGWQKIDLVNYTKEEKATFKELVLLNAKPIV